VLFIREREFEKPQISILKRLIVSRLLIEFEPAIVTQKSTHDAYGEKAKRSCLMSLGGEAESVPHRHRSVRGRTLNQKDMPE
jgi:hypothetical protein